MSDRGHVTKRPISQLLWGRYPIRFCRTLNHCELCGQDITIGQPYYDGGYSRRGHKGCVEDRKLHYQGLRSAALPEPEVK